MLMYDPGKWAKRIGLLGVPLDIIEDLICKIHKIFKREVKDVG